MKDIHIKMIVTNEDGTKHEINTHMTHKLDICVIKEVTQLLANELITIMESEKLL